MVIELAPLGSLCAYLNNITTWYKKLKALRNISQGLMDLHDSNLTHGDFHPGNLLFKSENSLLITDLGLCRPVNENLRSNNIYGVMPYVAPEVLKGKTYTKEADVYSFGMVMYFVATRKQPFNNSAHDQVLALRICNGDRPEISDSEAPKCYIDLMKKCWDSDPNNRPNIAEVKDLINSFTYNEEFNKKEYNRKSINNDQSTHSQAIYTSRLLNPYTKDLSDDCAK